MTHFNLKDLLTFVLSHVEAMSGSKEIKVSLQLDPNIPEFLYADPLALRQVLTNLTHNAFKFTKQGEVSLLVYQLDTTKTKVHLHFQVADTGIGIDPKNHQLLFEPFTQAVNHHPRIYGETGLGLAISHDILKLMDSQLELKSILNKGSQFFFSVWLEEGKKPAKEEPDSDTGLIKIEKKPVEALFSEQLILVIEDDPMNQLVIEKMLQTAGLTPIIAESGKIALETLQTIHPQLIFMDLQMPKQDGFETTRQIRANPLFSEIPIIALTAHASSEDEHKCLEMGMQGFITKPIDMVQLYQLLERFLHSEGNQTTEQEVQSNLSFILDELGNDSARQFMQKTAQYLKDSHNELQSHLTHKDWEKAARCAHRIRGSSNLYGSSQLSQLLLDLDNKKVRSEEIESFKKALGNEFSIIISSMEDVIKKEVPPSRT